MSVKSRWILCPEVEQAIDDAAANILDANGPRRPDARQRTAMIARLTNAVEGYLDDEEEHDDWLRAKANGEDC